MKERAGRLQCGARRSDRSAASRSLVGVNAYTETEPSPLTANGIEGIRQSRAVEIEQIAALQAWRARRDDKAVRQALADLEAAAAEGRNIMPPSIACAKAGVTTGEWGGEPAQGVRRISRADRRRRQARDRARRGSRKFAREVEQLSGKLAARSLSWSASPVSTATPTAPSRSPSARAMPGWRWSMTASGSRPPRSSQQAREADAHVVGLSILSGSHVSLVREVVAALARGGPGRCTGRRRRHHPARGRQTS